MLRSQQNNGKIYMFIRQMLTPGVTQQTGEDNSGATYF